VEKRSSTAKYILLPTSRVRSVHQHPDTRIGNSPNETKPLGSATLLKAFFAGFLTCPQRSISRVESIKKKCFKQVVVQIHCKTEEYDYNQPAIKIR